MKILHGYFSVPALVALVSAAGVSYAQQDPVNQFPRKTIRLLASEPGGGQDFAARIYAQGLAEPLGQPVIVDNRAGSFTATEIVARAAPDGYTLLVISGALWVVPLLRKAPYDPVKGFAPITLSVSSPNILVLHPSVPINSVKELIAYAKAKPGELNYVGAGTGTSSHLAAELFKAMAGVNLTHVPTRNSGAAALTVLRGEAQLTFLSSSSVAAHIKSGKLKALAITSVKPSVLAQGLPTVAETVPGYELRNVSTVFAPAGTPKPIVVRLNREAVRVLNRADVKEKFLNVGSEIVGSSPEELGAVMKSEMARLTKVIKDAGIREE